MPTADNIATALLAERIASLPTKLGKEHFRVFVFGPALGVDEVVAEPAASEPTIHHAKFLRYYLAKQLRMNGWPVDFGESPELLNMWRNLRPVPLDVGKFEYDHALLICGAIVILPSSPGSFCEMGLFASSKGISQKTLAVVHDGHENDTSFFRTGLVRVFQSRRGSCRYKSYKDKLAVAKLVIEFVEDKFNDHNWDENDISVGEQRKREKNET